MPWMPIWRIDPSPAHKEISIRYKRIVATCIVDGARWMVRMGWAFDFARYSDGYYATEQVEAKAHRRGLWHGECEMPWDWRRSR